MYPFAWWRYHDSHAELGQQFVHGRRVLPGEYEAERRARLLEREHHRRHLDQLCACADNTHDAGTRGRVGCHT